MSWKLWVSLVNGCNESHGAIFEVQVAPFPDVATLYYQPQETDGPGSGVETVGEPQDSMHTCAGTPASAWRRTYDAVMDMCPYGRIICIKCGMPVGRWLDNVCAPPGRMERYFRGEQAVDEALHQSPLPHLVLLSPPLPSPHIFISIIIA